MSSKPSNHERPGFKKQFNVKKRPGTGNKHFKKEGQSSKEEEIKHNTDGTMEFLNLNMLKKKSVRCLLRKRAKKYECKDLGVIERVL